MNFLFSKHIFDSICSARYETVDINVAIATDNGVFVAPIVYNADQKVN